MENVKINLKGWMKATKLAFVAVCLSFCIIPSAKAENNIEYIKSSSQYSESYVAAFAKSSNDVCDIKKMKEKYQESCYSCKVVKTLTETFMKACSKAYPTAREAGTKLAILGAVIWLVLYAFRNVSSFTNLEPQNYVNDLLIFAFKVFIALVFLNAGIGWLISYIIEPILVAGADYGMGIVSSTTTFVEPAPEFKYSGVEIISSTTINKLFGLNQAIDKTVSENLVIGNALVCHSQNAGAWVDESFFFDKVSLKLPNLWIMICGALIWFFGFMLTLAVSYYVLDVSFKIGFGIIILPVVIGLWPFPVTQDKLGKTISIMLKSAAIFAFLAITTSYALVLIGQSLGGIDEIYKNIEEENTTWISERFKITGSYFILILFAYFYSMKLIGATIGSYVNKFFSDSVFGNASPIHSKATHATDIVKKKSVHIAKHVGKAGAKAAVVGARGVVNSLREPGGGTLIGGGVKKFGQAVQGVGRLSTKVGQLNVKAAQKLQKFGSKQSQKGLEKRNVVRLAAGKLAGKVANDRLLAAANHAHNASKIGDIGGKIEKFGGKINDKYREEKGYVKGAVNQTVGAVKKDVKMRVDSVKEDITTAKEHTVDAVKRGANAVGDAAKNTKVYKAGAKTVAKISDGASQVHSTLQSGYRTAKYNAIAVKNEAVDLGKRTWIYKGTKGAIKGVRKGANFVKTNMNQLYGNVKGGVSVVKTHAKAGVQEVKKYAKSTGVYKAGQAGIGLARDARDNIRNVYEDSRQIHGIQAALDKEARQTNLAEAKAFAKNTAKKTGKTIKKGTIKLTSPVWKPIDKGVNAAREKLYDKFGAKFEEDLGNASSTVEIPEITDTKLIDEAKEYGLSSAEIKGKGFSLKTNIDGSLRESMMDIAELGEDDVAMFDAYLEAEKTLQLNNGQEYNEVEARRLAQEKFMNAKIKKAKAIAEYRKRNK